MFAFAIWGERSRILFVAQDRPGMKPHYYYANAKRFAFAPEVKGLPEFPEFPRQLDTSALGEYVRRRYVIAPHNMLKDVRKLEPGHTATITEHGIRVQQFWDVPLKQPQKRRCQDQSGESASLASYTEGWPNVFNEALACGTPVVASRVGGVSAMVPSCEFGTIVPPGDQGALDVAVTAGLVRVWNREAIGHWRRSRSWARVASEVLESFEQIMRAGLATAGHLPKTADGRI